MILKNNVKDCIKDLILNLELKSKEGEYYHPHKGEYIKVRLYWNETKCEWGTKEEAIRYEINKLFRPIIDEVIKENEDFIKFFI